MKKVQKDITSYFFGENFLKDHAGRIMREPDFALQEIVANSWDAGATKVLIKIPERQNGIISFEDNGEGMNEDQFKLRWNTINYNRRKYQGKKVNFPDGTLSNRRPYGRNGKGRHALFCFADSYYVKTWRDGEKNKFNIKISKGIFKLFLQDKKKIRDDISGTKIWAKLIKHFITPTYVIGLIGSKFIADPSFEIFVNDEKVTPQNLEGFRDTFLVNTDFGPIEIDLYDTQSISRTTQWSGIVWRVNKRIVGKPSWKMARKSFLDGRKKEARRYTFIVKSDILEEEVKPDWSGFNKTDKFISIFEIVSNKIIEELGKIFKDKRNEIKSKIVKTHKNEIRKLSRLSRDKILDFIINVQINCPSISEKILDDLTNTLISLEESISGYELLAKLSKVTSIDLDDLNEILSKWTIIEAKTVLNDLEKRLNLIEKLQLFTDKKSDELHELQPLFKMALWIFGAEFDAAQFTSNQTINTVIKIFFHSKYKGNIQERPDFVIIPNGSVGLYTSNDYNEKSELIDIKKIVIIELKRGQFKLNQEQMFQAMEYAKILREKASLPESTKIVGYILGSYKDPYIDEYSSGTNTVIFPMTYNIVLQRAHARTFNLIQKIREAKKIREEDEDIKEIMSQKIF